MAQRIVIGKIVGRGVERVDVASVGRRVVFLGGCVNESV